VKSVITVSHPVHLRDPVLIEGLPGLGFIATLTARYLIQTLAAEKFAEISSPYFQDVAITTSDTSPRTPVNELYYWASEAVSRDLIILYGNTQALMVAGQYELSGRILDFVQDLGCNFVICPGGLKRDSLAGGPHLYGTFTDLETMKQVQRYGVKTMEGRIFGMAGLLLGLASLREMRGFCLLKETLGTSPDVAAAKEVLAFLLQYFGFSLDLRDLPKVAKDAFKVVDFLGVPPSKRMEDVFGHF
jgi:uncharacterized protein (TIGR00162 family)